MPKISIRELYQNDIINYMLVGSMGDYVEKQDFSTILIEKMAYIANHGMCLWASAGPSLKAFEEFKKFSNDNNRTEFEEDEKRIYALLSLTTSPYTSDLVMKYTSEYCGKKLEATGPVKNSGKYKGLVIKKFYQVEEDFSIEDFYDLYYRFENVNSYDGKFSSDVKKVRSQLQMVVSKKEILRENHGSDVQKRLGIMDDERLQKFREEKVQNDIVAPKFLLNNDNDSHPIIYI
ncbi:MAG: hypothetical protein LUF27_16215, partial [Lachnospiraceae bacterium]|nr:hypothetical protein [Lachnospiraceae bacterium]